MPTIFMISLGCAKNLVDAETMLGETLDDEFSLAVDPSMADVVIVNTCGFIQDARDEARETLTECLAMKKGSKRRIRIVAAGCWAQREPDKLLEEFPGLDAVWGLGVDSSLKDAIRALGVGAGPTVCGTEARASAREGTRLLTTGPSFAYLRLSDGCDNRCHYCAIPLIRGGLRSREPGAVLDEAKVLAEQGIREIVLISQDTTAYGHDLKKPGATLPDLLERLLAEVDVPRFRVLYAHPAHLEDRVIGLLKSEPRLCGYLDLPIQHASDGVLSRMGRGYGRERILEIIDRLGKGFTLRTTLLMGYPGETEADFLEALRLVEGGHFRHLGAFAYSPEPGTKAFSYPDAVSAEVAAERRDAVMEAQAGVAFSWLDSRIGGMEEVLVDSRGSRDWVTCRSVNEAPDADGVIFVKDRERQAGEMVMACINGRDGYDLLGKIKVAGGGKKRRR